MADTAAQAALDPPGEPETQVTSPSQAAPPTSPNSLIPMIRTLLPKVPLIAKTALYHTLGFSEHSKEWDLRSEVTVNVLRSFVVDSPPQSISKTQHMLNKDPGIKGRIWVSTATFPPPQEDSLRQALFTAIEELKEEGVEKGGFKEPDCLPVEAEWTGYRAAATPSSSPPKIPEEEKYKELMKEVTSPVTILYLHGGAYYLLDPSSHRPTTKKLAKLTKGRVLSVRYRLAPQNPFPAALLDALIVYLNLLYPPPGSFHTAVPPETIVLAGDSAGGNLSLSLLQTLLQFQRQNVTISWNGQQVEIPLPGACSLNSAWCDITHSSPSCSQNGNYDYLPIPTVQSARDFPPCSAWPSSPPRSNLYAEDILLCHPLVSPISAASWKGSPPLFIECGTELLTDENKYLAQLAASQDVVVVFEEFESMPHCFGLLFSHMPGSLRMFEAWTRFINDVVERREKVVSKGTVIKAKTLEEKSVDLGALCGMGREEILGRMRERVRVVSEKGRGIDTLAKL